jgi:hypothetical protein
MIKPIIISLIPGVMLGLEWDYINGFLVLDLLIIRIVVDLQGVEMDT